MNFENITSTEKIEIDYEKNNFLTFHQTQNDSILLINQTRISKNEMSSQFQILWIVTFVLMVTAAICGNIIVIWSVAAHKRMRTVTNYLLVNLSIADLMMSLLNCSFNFIYMIKNNWNFGDFYCTINNFVANLTVAASVFTLMSISVDRYIAIVRPLKPRMSKSSVQIIIIVIWLSSITLAIPCLLYSSTIKYSQFGQIACVLIWPDGQPLISRLDYTYNIIIFVTTYLAPMSAMIWCYSAMGKTLWGSRSIGEKTQRQVDCIKSKRKVVKMLFLIVIIFAICWLPYHSYFIYMYHQSQIVYSNYVQHLYLAFYWLAMANAMLNPLIYYLMNSRMKHYFKTALCNWKCHIKKRKFHSSQHYSPSYSRSVSSSPIERFRYRNSYSNNNIVNKRKFSRMSYKQEAVHQQITILKYNKNICNNRKAYLSSVKTTNV